MASLNEFVAAIQTEGLMRTSRFSVNFNIPASIQQNIDLRKVLLYCESVNLPSVSVETTAAKTYGETREMPYNRVFDPINMTFYVDNSMQVKLLFDKWINSIQNPQTRVMSYYIDYVTQMDIQVYDIQDQSRYTVTLYDAYPKTIGAIQMDYSGKDVMKLQVTMNYKYWTSSATGDTPTNTQLDQIYYPSSLGTPTNIPDTYYTNFQSFQNGVAGIGG